ncbi:AAA family ATPase [Svornostia abyssi]|uniref:AAA family ATPase n=1 Tax=Svornostia abyssi TaxID=2898438 RepID=A0ABY5PKG5_9ACTN|nr:AAA family ATPase [Parviterribacteraceae bacterium J379]
MDIYALANQKGGVGKTTVTLGLAAALARRGARTLLVDLDPQASATKVLDVDTSEQHTVADVLLEPGRYVLSETLVDTTWGFRLAPAETALASREARRSTADEFLLREQLRRLDGFDVVLIDCPPSLGVLTLNALAATTRTVVVTEPAFLALQGIEELLRTHELVVAHYNLELKLAGVIVNRVERTVEHRAGLAELTTFFGAELLWSPWIAKRTVLQEGTRRGVALEDLRSRAAGDVAAVFELLADRIEARRVVA